MIKIGYCNPLICSHIHSSKYPSYVAHGCKRKVAKHNNTLDVGIRDAEASAVQINPHLYYTSPKYYSSPSAKMMPWMMAHHIIPEISVNSIFPFGKLQ